MAIYLAGPVSKGENPYAWHERIQRMSPETEWINPFKLNDYDHADAREHHQEIIELDLEAVRNADAVLLRRIAKYNLCGASMEAREAYVHDVPVVVWNEDESDIPLFLEGHSTFVTQSLEEAIAEVERLARKTASIKS